MVETKIEYSFGTCLLKHDNKNKCLYVTLLKRGRVFFNSTIRNVKASFAKVFVNKFTEEDVRDMFKNDMFIL